MIKLLRRFLGITASRDGKHNQEPVDRSVEQSMGEFNAKLKAGILGDIDALAEIISTRDDVAVEFDWGCAYYHGEGVSKDLSQAASRFRKAAEKGHAQAQHYLGYMYANGEGVLKDAAQAVGWYRKAADQGIPDAQIELGLCYLGGEGVSVDFALAAGLFRKAAEQGISSAQCYLGAMFETGYGVPKDLVTAYMWANLAAAQCDKDGMSKRDELEKQMTPDQIADAQKLSREWKPKK